MILKVVDALKLYSRTPARPVRRGSRLRNLSRTGGREHIGILG